jgi:hypothetical protein
MQQNSHNTQPGCWLPTFLPTRPTTRSYSQQVSHSEQVSHSVHHTAVPCTLGCTTDWIAPCPVNLTLSPKLQRACRTASSTQDLQMRRTSADQAGNVSIILPYGVAEGYRQQVGPLPLLMQAKDRPARVTSSCQHAMAISDPNSMYLRTSHEGPVVANSSGKPAVSAPRRPGRLDVWSSHGWQPPTRWCSQHVAAGITWP